MKIKIIVIGFIFLILGWSGTYIGFRIWFKTEINQICKNAMSKYEGDKIEALLSVLNSSYEDLNVKNNSIWALGKLKDKRALFTLKELYTGSECEHSRFVCQQELDKAIKNLQGESIDILTFR